MKYAAEKKELLIEIEMLRKQLIGLGMKNGFMDKDVLILSKKLDSLIVSYQRITLQTEKVV